MDTETKLTIMLYFHWKEQKSCVQGDNVLHWEPCPRLEEEPGSYMFERRFI